MLSCPNMPILRSQYCFSEYKTRLPSFHSSVHPLPQVFHSTIHFKTPRNSQPCLVESFQSSRPKRPSSPSTATRSLRPPPRSRSPDTGHPRAQHQTLTNRTSVPRLTLAPAAGQSSQPRTTTKKTTTTRGATSAPQSTRSGRGTFPSPPPRPSTHARRPRHPPNARLLPRKPPSLATTPWAARHRPPPGGENFAPSCASASPPSAAGAVRFAAVAGSARVCAVFWRASMRPPGWCSAVPPNMTTTPSRMTAVAAACVATTTTTTTSTPIALAWTSRRIATRCLSGRRVWRWRRRRRRSAGSRAIRTSRSLRRRGRASG
ncbi:hypothetical protein HDK77DRAFT_501456 [Phyllosticta capitalensis]|uniref:Uncharacterized protein n=1 Tax=Phyllosticta capitalensis TaxID=121624 RepID=A0ABR1YF74_9PEZI